MAIGTMAARKSARNCQMLKRAGNVSNVVSIVSIVIYVSISTFMIWEAWRTLQYRNDAVARESPGTAAKRDESSFSHRTEAIRA